MLRNVITLMHLRRADARGLDQKTRCGAAGANLRWKGDGPRVERRGVKREHGETRFWVEAVAAPATVSGEQHPTCHWPEGWEGRMKPRPASQETCHQHELTGRGVPGGDVAVGLLSDRPSFLPSPVLE